jgi:RND family efflux transporter MFP subunit
MNRSLPLPCVLPALLWLAACKSTPSEALPPPTGSGAAPLPVIASVSALAASTAPAERGLMVTGTARALHEAKLGPRVTGVIDAMLVEEGDRVKKGQVLFRLRSAAQDLGVQQAEAALATARVMKSSAQTELERTQALAASGSVAPAVLDQVKARYDAAAAGVRQAEAAVSSARQASSDTTVTSPIAGIVASRRASVGETVTMMPPTVVLVVQDIDTLEVRANLPETALATLHPGSNVRVRFPAVDVVRDVPITRVNPSVDPMTRTIEVVAEVPNADHALKAGMLVECDFRPPDVAAAASVSAAATDAAAPPTTGSARP